MVTPLLKIALAVYVAGLIGIEDPGYLYYNWQSIEWDEYADVNDELWNLEAWQLDINTASVYQLSALPGFDPASAQIVVRERSRGGVFKDQAELDNRTGLTERAKAIARDMISFNNVLPVNGRLHIKAQQRFGVASKDAADRYDGSAAGITQRYSLTAGRLRAGFSSDKDSYEPSLIDLTRLWIAWRGDNSSIVAGDFHLTYNRGMALWTRSVYFDNYNSQSSYRRMARGVQPAADVSQNSAFRGIAINRKWQRIHADLFVANTRLDAVFDDSLGVQKLTRSGLHYTPGGQQNRNAVTEKAAGGAVTFLWDEPDRFELLFTLVGYIADYSPPFTPEFDRRDRFQLTGHRAGAVGLGGSLAANR